MGVYYITWWDFSSGSMVSGTDLTSFTVATALDLLAKKEKQQAELAERAWQRQAAIFVVFVLFFIISIIVMVIIHGGIQENGIVLSVHKVTVDTSVEKR